MGYIDCGQHGANVWVSISSEEDLFLHAQVRNIPAVSAGIFLVTEMECKYWKNTCCFGAFAAFGSGACVVFFVVALFVCFSSSKCFTAFFFLLRSSLKNLVQSTVKSHKDPSNSIIDTLNICAGRCATKD